MKSDFSLPGFMALLVIVLALTGAIYYLRTAKSLPIIGDLIPVNPLEKSSGLEIYTIWIGSRTLIDAELATLEYFSESNYIDYTSDLDRLNELYRQVFQNIKDHYETQGEIEKVEIWLQRIPSGIATRSEIDQWLAEERLRWRNNVYHQGEANNAIREGRLGDAYWHLGLIENYSPFWQQHINDLHNGISQGQLVACQSLNDQYLQGDIPGANWLTFSGNPSYQSMCEEIGVTLP
jgi:hypothetical protein